jgi:hypothetical protein
MTKEKQKAALEFLFKEMGKDTWLTSRVLTKANNIDPNAPGLTLAEAESIFALLRKNELIIQTQV